MAIKRLSFSQNATYATIGVLINNFCLWLTTLVVVRFSNDYSNAGIWQLAISVTNVFAALAAFNLSTFYVSDTKNDNNDNEYISTQIVAIIISFMLCVSYTLLCGHRGMQFFCIVMYMICRSVETFAGFLFAIEQRNYRMDFVGISFALRGVLSTVLFSVVLYFWNNILFAIVAMVIASGLVLAFYDYHNAKAFVKTRFIFSFDSVKSILIKCAPYVCSFSVLVAINTVPRQVLEHQYGEDHLGYYATIAAPIVVLQVIAVNAFNPILRDLALAFQDNNTIVIKKIFRNSFVMLTGLTIIAVAATSLFGRVFYSFVYGKGILDYFFLSYAIIICSALYAACWMVWSVLVTMRKTKFLVLSSSLALCGCISLSFPFIRMFSLNGVSFTIILAYLLFFILGCFGVIAGSRQRLR